MISTIKINWFSHSFLVMSYYLHLNCFLFLIRVNFIMYAILKLNMKKLVQQYAVIILYLVQWLNYCNQLHWILFYFLHDFVLLLCSFFYNFMNNLMRACVRACVPTLNCWLHSLPSVILLFILSFCSSSFLWTNNFVTEFDLYIFICIKMMS